MAYVPSFEHDVFISYAHADNAGTQRVDALKRDLATRLTQRLGGRAFRESWIFLDSEELRLGDEFRPELERRARRSNVMIALVSRSYLQAPYCTHERRWFGDDAARSRDGVGRRLIPILFHHVDEPVMQTQAELAGLHRGRLCTRDRDFAPGSPEWNTTLDLVALEVAEHLVGARKLHGAVFVGPAYTAAEAARASLQDELRGFRCVPEEQIFHSRAAIETELGKALVAVHFLGNTEMEPVKNTEAIEWSLECCPGKTVGYVPPGRKLDAEQGFLDEIRDHRNWTLIEGTRTNLAEYLKQELESYRRPDPSQPLALACEADDLAAVRRMAKQIVDRRPGAFDVYLPEFLIDPKATSRFNKWKELLLERDGIVVYWRDAQQERLEKQVHPFLPAAKRGRTWYVSMRNAQDAGKRGWQPQDSKASKILDEHDEFTYELIQAFLADLAKGRA